MVNTREIKRRGFYHGSSTYVCDICGKRTRDTGNDEKGVGLCLKCYELSGLENSLSDGHITKAEYDRKVIIINQKFGGK